MWTEAALLQLQDCLHATLQDLLEHHNLQEYTDTVLPYIKNCVDTVTVNKGIQAFRNQKPRMTSEVQTLPKRHNTAFRSGDRPK